MRTTTSLLLAAALWANAAPALAETPGIAYPHPVPAAASGSGDAQPSVVPKPGTPVPLASGVDYSGTIVADIAIAIRSDVPSGTPIYCSVTMTVGGDSNPYAAITRTNFVTATRSGGSADCKVSVPYALYGLLSPGRDYVSSQFEILAGAEPVIGVGIANATSSPTSGSSLVGALPIAALPASGKVTTFKVSAVI
jgi:hypothetical protein